MANPRIVRSLALVVLLAMLSVACGQKEGVHNVGFNDGTGGTGSGGDFGEGDVIAGGDGTTTDDGGFTTDGGETG
ncbi:MAG: hypothetical protein ACLGI3_07650, partial [Actinomycetes bacterium]